MSKSYPDKATWDRFFSVRYDDLIVIAKRHTSDPIDLLHHCYLRCLRTAYPENPMGYAVVTLFREATRGQFKRIYSLSDSPHLDNISDEVDLTLAFRREQMQMVIDRLSWFDRNVMNLYLEGWSMVEVANGTDIAVGTLYQSLHRSRKYIVDALRQP